MGLRSQARRVLQKLKHLADPNARLVARVAAAKRARAESRHAYRDDPRLSLILLSFNHRSNIGPILDRLRRTSADELIVCEDGSIDGSEREWLRCLDRPNEFLIRSNDIHEIRAYNRAVGLARGEFVCVLQDDDIPPDEGSWVECAMGFFERYPQLAILGGNQGYELDLEGPIDNMRARRIFGYRADPCWQHVLEIPFVDPESAMPFMFVEGVSFGPVFYRREVFQDLSGFDLRFSKPGESGILADHEICLKAWLAGWHVGLFGPAPFRKYVGGQGTLMFGPKGRWRNLVANTRQLQRLYGHKVGAIETMVDELNSALGARTDVTHVEDPERTAKAHVGGPSWR